MVCPVSMTWPQCRRGECGYKGFVTPLSGQETDVLAALLMRGLRPTPADLLAQILWGSDPDGGREDAAAGIGAVHRRLHAKLPGAIGGRSGFGWFLNIELVSASSR